MGERQAMAAAERRASEAAAPAVSARGVDMVYGGAHAVRDASFTLAEGRFLTILGPSGSGKTTLLRMIAGFQRPTRGEIRIFGRPVADLPPHRRSVGMVFQRLALFPHMTAAENVAFPLKMRRFDAREIPDRVARYLSLVKLDGLGGRRPHELSGGQQQRVAIARALSFEPELLLLDEPLAALDRKLREEMQLEFRRIQHELGVTTINVTHDQREALVMSDEVIVMEAGAIRQHAEPAAVYREPADPFVAAFIGVTDFLDGVARAGPDGPALAVGAALLPARAAVPPADGAPARGAIRAEQVRVAADRAALAGLDVALAAVVEDAIFEGDRVLYETRVPALGGARLRAIDHDPESGAPHARGAAVWLGWRRRDLILFAGDGGGSPPKPETTER